MFSSTPTPQFFAQPCTPNPTFSTLFGQQQPSSPPIFGQSQILPWGQAQSAPMTQPSQVGFNFNNLQQQTQPLFQGNFGGQPNVFEQQVVQQQPAFVQQPFQTQQQPQQIQYQFGQQQQQPFLLQPQQPIIQTVLPVTYQQQLSPEIVFVPYVLDESGRISPKRECSTSWDSDMASFPEKYTRTSILQKEGRGPSILSTDPKYQSPVFDWGRNLYSGQISAIGYNRDLQPTVTKLPGEQTAENGRRFLSMSDKMELDMLRNEVEILKAGDFNNTINLRKKMNQPPPKVGLFDQPVNDDAWYDAWNKCERGPPKYNDDIDPITGRTLLEKLTSPVNPRWTKRPVGDNSYPSRRFIDTSFDIHSSSPRLNYRERQAPSTSTSNPLVTLHRNSPSPGLMRLGLSQRLLSEDMLPVYRPPRRIGGGDNNYATNFGHGSACGVILRSAKCYCIPSLQELDDLYSPITRKTVVRDFKVGHMDHGEVTFPGELNVTGLNLDAILHFSHKQLEVYPNNHNKPAHGHGLNRRAIVSLRNVFPKQATHLTGENFIPDQNYEQVLKRACERFKGKFLNYNRFTGYWVFEIQNEPDDN